MPHLRFDVRYPHGVPFPTPWDEVAQAVRDRTLDPTDVLRWHVGKIAPVETSAWLLALGARTDGVPLDTVRPVLDACVAWGVSLYHLPPTHPRHATWHTLAHVRDPARLSWWLDQGGDPAVQVGEGSVAWWAFVDAGHLALLDVLRARPQWPRWATARDDQGDHVRNRWAWLEAPPGPYKPGSAGTMVQTYAWLEQHVPPFTPSGPDASLRNEALATLWTQALEGQVKALVVWDRLLEDPGLTPGASTRALWDRWTGSALANRSGGREAIVRRMGQALEAAELRRAVATVGSVPVASPLPRPRL